ncbi:hypothetical protein ACHAWF_005793 [Thalassiosira exigua]
MPSGKGSKLLRYVEHRLRIALADGRQIVGTFLAFDKHLNLVLSDAEEFRTLSKSRAAVLEERQEKRSLGLIILRGENVVSVAVEGPPPPSAKRAAQGGPGTARGVGRGAMPPPGMPPPPGGAPMGLGAGPGERRRRRPSARAVVRGRTTCFAPPLFCSLTPCLCSYDRQCTAWEGWRRRGWGRRPPLLRGPWDGACLPQGWDGAGIENVGRAWEGFLAGGDQISGLEHGGGVVGATAIVIAKRIQCLGYLSCDSSCLHRIIGGKGQRWGGGGGVSEGRRARCPIRDQLHRAFHRLISGRSKRKPCDASVAFPDVGGGPETRQ